MWWWWWMLLLIFMNNITVAYSVIAVCIIILYFVFVCLLLWLWWSQYVRYGFHMFYKRRFDPASMLCLILFIGLGTLFTASRVGLYDRMYTWCIQLAFLNAYGKQRTYDLPLWNIQYNDIYGCIASRFE